MILARLFHRLTLTLAALAGLGLGIAGFALPIAADRAPNAITLLYFRATARADSVYLRWETGAEVDHGGFFLYRSTVRQDPNRGVRLADFPPRGDVGGAVYEYTDTDVVVGTTYYYSLVAVDVRGNETTYFTDPPGVTPGQTQPTPTPTPTATSTPLPTATPMPPSNEGQTPPATATPTFTLPAPPAAPTPTLPSSGVQPQPTPPAPALPVVPPTPTQPVLVLLPSTPSAPPVGAADTPTPQPVEPSPAATEPAAAPGDTPLPSPADSTAAPPDQPSQPDQPTPAGQPGQPESLTETSVPTLAAGAQVPARQPRATPRPADANGSGRGTQTLLAVVAAVALGAAALLILLIAVLWLRARRGENL